jgi:hypothetical protein
MGEGLETYSENRKSGEDGEAHNKDRARNEEELKTQRLVLY